LFSIFRFVYNVSFTLLNSAMSKEKAPSKNTTKKEPEKSLKEKRAEKKAKRDSKSRD